MTTRTWSLCSDLDGVGTAMITSRVMSVPSSAHSRRVANPSRSPRQADFADPLGVHPSRMRPDGTPPSRAAASCRSPWRPIVVMVGHEARDTGPARSTRACGLWGQAPRPGPPRVKGAARRLGRVGRYRAAAIGVGLTGSEIAAEDARRRRSGPQRLTCRRLPPVAPRIHPRARSTGAGWPRHLPQFVPLSARKARHS
jgi:hypothetical protein